MDKPLKIHYIYYISLNKSYNEIANKFTTHVEITIKIDCTWSIISEGDIYPAEEVTLWTVKNNWLS